MSENYYEDEIFTNMKVSDESYYDYEFVDCTFEKGYFENIKLRSCKFSGCRFEDCIILNPEADYSQLRDAEFVGCRLVGVNWGSIVPEGGFAAPLAQVERCQLRYNTFSAMELQSLVFRELEILASSFTGCDLRSSDFTGSKLEDTEFVRCDLRGADFRRATGYQVDTATNRLERARFSFPEVVNLLAGTGIEIEY